MTCLSYLDRRAFTKGTVWEIGRTQVGENAVAVWKTRVQGQARTIGASGPTRLTFKSFRGMKETAAVDVVNSWGFSGAAEREPTGTVNWLAAMSGSLLVSRPGPHILSSLPPVRKANPG